MGLEPRGLSVEQLVLRPDGEGVEYVGERSLVEYDIRLLHFDVEERSNISVATVKIVFRRRMEFHVFSTFTQTGILVLAGYVTFHFDVEDFTNRVMVVLTSLLAAATIISSVQNVNILCSH